MNPLAAFVVQIGLDIAIITEETSRACRTVRGVETTTTRCVGTAWNVVRDMLGPGRILSSRRVVNGTKVRHNAGRRRRRVWKDSRHGTFQRADDIMRCAFKIHGATCFV